MSVFAPSEEARRKGHLASLSEASREKLRATRALKRELLDEDILLLWKRGLVPLAIAAKLRVPVDRVSSVVRENGYEIAGYLTTSGPTPEADTCPHCGKDL